MHVPYPTIDMSNFCYNVPKKIYLTFTLVWDDFSKKTFDSFIAQQVLALIKYKKTIIWSKRATADRAVLEPSSYFIQLKFHSTCFVYLWLCSSQIVTVAVSPRKKYWKFAAKFMEDWIVNKLQYVVRFTIDIPTVWSWFWWHSHGILCHFRCFNFN